MTRASNLVVVLSGLLLVACGDRASPNAESPPTVYDAILSYELADEITFRYLRRVLDANGIAWKLEGSFARGLLVPRKSEAEATRLLKKESGLRGYVQWHSESEFNVSPPPFKSEAIGADYASAIVKYPESTIIGRILRSPSAGANAPEALRVESVKWRDRQFVSKALERTTATQAKVEVLWRSPPPYARPRHLEFAVELYGDE